MRRNGTSRVLLPTLALPLLSLSGCLPDLRDFRVPAQVSAGHEFEVVVHGAEHLGEYGVAGNVGCVLQLPSGFTITRAVLDWQSLQVQRDDAALLSHYTAEPGHYLAGFSGASSAPGLSLSLMVQPPTGPVGTYDIKVALAGDPVWTPVTPTNFAGIVPGGANAQYVRTFALSASPTTFVGDNDGLALPPYTGWGALALGDIDDDGDDDLGLLASVAPGQSLPTTWLSRPGSPWTERPINVNTGQSSLAAFGDFDGDGHLDFAAGQTIFFGDGHGGWTPGPNLFAASPDMLAVADVDRDGCADIVYRSFLIDRIQLFRGSASRVFQDSSAGLPSATNPSLPCRMLFLADVTGDGNADVVSCVAGQPTVFPGDGHGNWGTGINVGFSSASAVRGALGDFTGDGVPDLVLSGNQGMSIFQFTGGSWSVLPTNGLPLTYPRALAVLDYDRDGLPDIVETSSNNSFELWHDLGNGVFASAGGTGLPASASFHGDELLIGDVNGDGWPDVAATGPLPGVWLNMTAGSAAFGSGCGAPGFATPTVAVNSAPLLGNAGFAVELHNGPANGAGLLWLGFSKRLALGQPLLPFDLGPLGAPACTIVAEPADVSPLLLDAAGVAAHPLPLPANPMFQFMTVFAQGGVLAPGANALGALFTGGLAIRLQ